MANSINFVFKPMCILVRQFYFTPIRCGKYDLRVGKIMQKFVKGSSIKKKSWYRPESGLVSTPMPSHTSFRQGDRNCRRVSVLNKLFMKHITDLMATGEVADEILGRGIEISRVKVANDFSRVNVYWLAKGSKHDLNTETLLMTYSGQLRHELSQLRIIGSVPVIEFVKDKSYGKLDEVDHLLAMADFGEDYIPVDPSLHLKSEFILNMQFPANVKVDLEKFSAQDDFPEESMPAMRMDTLGLNHLDIMTKVSKSMRKSQALHRIESELESTDDLNIPSHSENNAVVLPNGDMAEFLIKRQRWRHKAIRGAKNYQPEMEMYEKDWEDSIVVNNFLKDIEDFEPNDTSELDDHYEDK